MLKIFWMISDVAIWVLFGLLMHSAYTLYSFKRVLKADMKQMLYNNNCNDDITEIIHDYRQKNNISYLPLLLQRIKKKICPKKKNKIKCIYEEFDIRQVNVAMVQLKDLG